jgi:hypothetical protein
VISITDTPSAARYGLQTASLSRSGDDGTSRSFVAPDPTALAAGEQSDVPSAVSGVLVPNPSTTAAGAYPLTLLSYASTAPETLTPAERQLYANFILFGIGDGQTSGIQPGQLPPGYVPLPGALRLEALNATTTILHPPAEPTSTTTTGDTGGASGTSSTGSVDTTAFNGDTSTASGDQTTSGATTAGSSNTAHGSGSSTLGLLRTSSLSVGRIRYLLPLLLLIGVGAGLGSLALARSNRVAAQVLNATDTPATEDIP